MPNFTADQVVAAARLYLGTPYRPQGRSQRGLDCLGLLVMIGRQLEIPHTDEANYSPLPQPDHLLLRRFGEQLEPVSMATEPQPGMVGVFAETRLPGHAGVFSWLNDSLHLIHARLTPARVVEEHYAGMGRRQIRLVGLFRFPGMIDG